MLSRWYFIVLCNLVSGMLSTIWYGILILVLSYVEIFLDIFIYIYEPPKQIFILSYIKLKDLLVMYVWDMSEIHHIHLLLPLWVISGFTHINRGVCGECWSHDMPGYPRTTMIVKCRFFPWAEDAFGSSA